MTSKGKDHEDDFDSGNSVDAYLASLRRGADDAFRAPRGDGAGEVSPFWLDTVSYGVPLQGAGRGRSYPPSIDAENDEARARKENAAQMWRRVPIKVIAGIVALSAFVAAVSAAVTVALLGGG